MKEEIKDWNMKGMIGIWYMYLQSLLFSISISVISNISVIFCNNLYQEKALVDDRHMLGWMLCEGDRDMHESMASDRANIYEKI